MKDIIDKIKSMIATETRTDMSEEQKYYVSGLSDALDVIENSVAENLIPGNTYHVIMYRDGNKFLPYIKEMKLYKISKGTVKSSYCFTYNMEQGKYHKNTPDLVLQSKRGLTERVFFTHEQAENAIKHF